MHWEELRELRKCHQGVEAGDCGSVGRGMFTRLQEREETLQEGREDQGCDRITGLQAGDLA